MNSVDSSILRQASETISPPADRWRLALRLYLAALALFALFGFTILNGALPARLLDPAWLVAMVELLLSQAFLPLIALVLLHLAVVLHPSSPRLRSRRDRYARLALVAALGFVLLIPLHLGATWNLLNRQLTSAQAQQALQGQEVISQLRQAISAATSHQDLERRLAALPIRQKSKGSAADLALPFAERQRNLLEGLARSEAELSRAATTAAPIPWTALIQPALRMMPSALALAGAFLVLGHGSLKPTPSTREILGQEDDYFEALGRESGG